MASSRRFVGRGGMNRAVRAVAEAAASEITGPASSPQEALLQINAALRHSTAEMRCYMRCSEAATRS